METVSKRFKYLVDLVGHEKEYDGRGIDVRNRLLSSRTICGARTLQIMPTSLWDNEVQITLGCEMAGSECEHKKRSDKTCSVYQQKYSNGERKPKTYYISQKDVEIPQLSTLFG